MSSPVPPPAAPSVVRAVAAPPPRPPSIALQRAEPLPSSAVPLNLGTPRPAPLHPETITEYFNVLKSTVNEFKIMPQNIYNMDGKGFLVGVIKKSMCVLIAADEKATFLRQSGD